MEVNSVKERILELIYGNVPLIPCDPEGPKVIKAHFEQALTLIAEKSDEKPPDTASAKTGNVK